MKIELKQRIKYDSIPLLEYESDIAPLVEDIYAGMNFADNMQRFVKERMLLPGCPNVVICYLEYCFPNLLPDKKTVTESEANLIVQESLS